LSNLVLQCSHTPQFRRQYSCQKSGDYVLELCKECNDSESKEFLIYEEVIK